MSDLDQFERRLAAALRSDADASARPYDTMVVAGAAIGVTDGRPTGRRGSSSRVVRALDRRRGVTLLAAAATLILVGGALAAGSGVPRLRSIAPPPAPSVDRVAVGSPDATSPSPRTSPSSSAINSPPPAPIAWTPTSVHEDWPAPVRNEPAGRAIEVPILWKSVVTGTCPQCVHTETWGDLADPTGDIGSVSLPWADIKTVTFCGICVSVEFVSRRPIGVDPGKLWFAYGLVVDTDGDGVADWRYGIDNEPVGTPGAYDGPSPFRWWRTDLHTGRTESTLNEALWEGGGPFWGNHGGQSGAFGLSFGGDVTGGVERGSVPKHFYAWAAVIEDGRVVATDYAPDAGWLVPSADAKK